jgi:hypothetical protein
MNPIEPHSPPAAGFAMRATEALAAGRRARVADTTPPARRIGRLPA